MLKTPKEIAEDYGFSVSHIRKLICKGIIKADKLGRCYAIDPTCVHNLKRRRKPNQPKKDDANGTIK